MLPHAEHNGTSKVAPVPLLYCSLSKEPATLNECGYKKKKQQAEVRPATATERKLGEARATKQTRENGARILPYIPKLSFSTINNGLKNDLL